MNRLMMCLVAMLALGGLLGSGVGSAPAAAAPVVPRDVGVYEEDFTTYTYKDYTENAAWDISNRRLSVSLLDAIWQQKPAVAVHAGGETVIVWEDSRSGSCNIYAQRLDVAGNQLWPADVCVNSTGSASLGFYPLALAVDGSGNAIVVWKSLPGIYAQRLGAAGNRLWAADVRVDSYGGAAYRDDPAVAVDRNGNVVVVWRDERNGDDDDDVYAQRLDPAGRRLWATDVRVNSDDGVALQSYPAVGVDGSGNAVVVWQDERNGNDDDDVYAQRLDPAGNKLWAADVRANSDSGIVSQAYPAVAVDGNSNTVVVWKNSLGIYIQRLDAAGDKLWTTDMRVNSDNTWAMAGPAVALDGGNNAVVVWIGFLSNIYIQRLDVAGNRLWPTEVRANSEDSDPSSLYAAALAVDGSNDAVVVWQDGRNGGYDIYTQRLDVAGNRLWNDDLRVHAGCGAAVQDDPAVAVGSGGNAIVVWKDWRTGDAGIYAQRLDTDGNRLWAADIQVNADGGAPYLYSSVAVAVDEGNNAVIVWEDRRDGGTGIYAQRLDVAGNKLWAADVRVNSREGVTRLLCFDNSDSR